MFLLFLNLSIKLTKYILYSFFYSLFSLSSFQFFNRFGHLMHPVFFFNLQPIIKFIYLLVLADH